MCHHHPWWKPSDSRSTRGRAIQPHFAQISSQVASTPTVPVILTPLIAQPSFSPPTAQNSKGQGEWLFQVGVFRSICARFRSVWKGNVDEVLFIFQSTRGLEVEEQFTVSAGNQYEYSSKSPGLLTRHDRVGHIALSLLGTCRIDLHHRHQPWQEEHTGHRCPS